MRSPFAFSISCVTTPMGAMELSLIRYMQWRGRGRECLCDTSLLIRSLTVCKLLLTDLWFPLDRTKDLLASRSVGLMSWRGNVAPSLRMFFMRSQNG